MKTIVIGGGASGLIAAITASKKSDVTIIEKNNKLGKKLLITGNGKCNFWNKEINLSKYNEESSNLLESVLKYKDKVYSYLTNNLGITPTNKDEYIYPYSKTASSVVTTLTKEIGKNNIDVLYNLSVTKISVDNAEITLSLSDNTTIKADKVIIACGGEAASKTGSDGSGYKLLKDLGIKITDVTASLVPIITNDQETSLWSGVRTNAKLSLYKDNELVKEETGEIQLTDYGISGIVTFNISRLVGVYLNNNTNFSLTIDFLPDINEDLISFLDNKNNLMKSNTLEELFETIFNYKLLNAILRRADIDKNTSWSNLNKEEKNRLINSIKCFEVSVDKLETLEKAQVCHGGVSLDEIDDNFSLKKYKNIKVIGELLDVDGDCGGFNLAFAFISGYIGGNSIDD